jgi:glycosyltransferase involved in cell wall biosynthesis
MKIAFLLHNAYGIGGTIRTTFNLADALAERHEVEIVSMMRHRAEPRLAISPRVRLVPLVDTRTGSADLQDPRHSEPARMFPSAEKRHRQYTRLIDQRVEDYLRRSDADVLIGTRPGVNVYLARFGPRRALRIAQEHLSHDVHSARLRAQLAPHYRQLDALITTTEADSAVYRKRMPLPGVRVMAVPNSVPPPRVSLSDGSSKIVAAAGRLAPGKRFDLLVEAFSAVRAEYPDWQLRIYGSGGERERLQQLITGLGLGGAAVLAGARSPIEPELAKASIVAVASDAESFGMTIVEAMRCGVPVVSTDCPLGPREIIRDEIDGRLVPVGDARELATALIDLIGNEPLRRKMGAAALERGAHFDPGPIAHRYEEIFTELAHTRRHRSWERRRPGLRTWLKNTLRRAGLLSTARGALRAGRRLTAGGFSSTGASDLSRTAGVSAPPRPGTH